MAFNINDLHNIPSFGVAGNFTGHLEQAGEAKDFLGTVTEEENAPKALFPTFIPKTEGTPYNAPEFLSVYPFSSEKIIFPSEEVLHSGNLQIEPECAFLCNVEWKDEKITSLTPVAFTASNDCSIRKEGAKKISEKKNWGECSKGISENFIPLENYNSDCKLSDYRIASYLLRGDELFEYGENSSVKSYSYIYEKLTRWLLEKLNNQKDSGPAENVYEYIKNFKPGQVLISIGATRYTDFGEHNFLKAGDKSIVVLYPESVYSAGQIKNMIKDGTVHSKNDISFLEQTVCVKKLYFS